MFERRPAMAAGAGWIGDPDLGGVSFGTTKSGYSTAEVCAAIGLSRASLARYRRAGIIAPRAQVVGQPTGTRGRAARTPRSGHATRGHRYGALALMRLGTARRMVKELGVNVRGAAVALLLLDELASVRAELQTLRASSGGGNPPAGGSGPMVLGAG